MNSILETLRTIFPLVVADIIYYHLIYKQKQELNNQLKSAFINNKINKILNIKRCKLSFWIVNYEKTYIQNYKQTSVNIENYKIQRKQVLFDNHLAIKKWRERQRQRQKKLNILRN